MNEVFNLKRFGLLFAKHTAEHIRIYLMAIAVLAGVILLGGSFIFFIIPGPPDPGLQTACFTMLMLISGTLFTSTIFSDYGIKSKAVPTITLPASAFEKFMVGWLYSYPIFFIIYTAVFFLVLSVFGHIGHWRNGHIQFMSLPTIEVIIMVVIYSILHAVALFGAIRFEKLHFIRTAFVFFISYASLLVANTLFLKVITGADIMKVAMPFGFLNFVEGGKNYSIVVIEGPSALILSAVFGVAVLIWVTAYFKVKEKEV